MAFYSSDSFLVLGEIIVREIKSAGGGRGSSGFAAESSFTSITAMVQLIVGYFFYLRNKIGLSSFRWAFFTLFNSNCFIRLWNRNHLCSLLNLYLSIVKDFIKNICHFSINFTYFDFWFFEFKHSRADKRGLPFKIGIN